MFCLVPSVADRGYGGDRVGVWWHTGRAWKRGYDGAVPLALMVGEDG